ncbi:MAG: hypothetical protein IJO50_01590 [Clostridia bacterium]|nr:hypothetical protein [Clostridia bacterium]
MKKYLLILLTVLLCLSVVGCAKDVQEEQPDATPTPAVSGEAEATEAPKGDETKSEATKAPAAEKTAAPTQKPKPATNEQVVSDDKAPKVYWAMDTYYHLANCSAGSGAQEVSWEMVKEIGLRQCPTCNPPRYENYVVSKN